MSRRLRRQLDFITGILATVSMIMIFFISPLLWFSMQDNASIVVWLLGFGIAYIACCLWEYHPKREQRRRRVRREYDEE